MNQCSVVVQAYQRPGVTLCPSIPSTGPRVKSLRFGKRGPSPRSNGWISSSATGLSFQLLKEANVRGSHIRRCVNSRVSPSCLKRSEGPENDIKHGKLSLMAPSSPHSTSPEAEETAPKPPPSPMQPLPPPPRAASAPREPVMPRQPTPETLARWTYLNQVERETKERGGGAKLNFEEFSRQMAADKGRRLGFVASWIEMASF